MREQEMMFQIEISWRIPIPAHFQGQQCFPSLAIRIGGVIVFAILNMPVPYVKTQFSHEILI